MSVAPIGRTLDLDSEWHTVDLVVPNPANIDPLQVERAALIARVNDLEGQVFRLDTEFRNTQVQNIALMQLRDDYTREIQTVREERRAFINTIADLTAENNRLREQDYLLREQVRVRDAAIRDLMHHEHRPDATLLEVVACILGIARCKLACAGIAH